MNHMTREEFGASIQKLIDRKNLTTEESYRLFREVMTNSQPDLQQGAFLAALTAKGETVEEIVGAWKAIDEFDTVHVTGLPDTIIDNSGTGMDSFKSFNVSSAAALVIAAHGIPVARHGARAITSCCGTVDMMEAMGINVECPAAKVAESINSAGIGLFNGMSPHIHPGSLGRILSQIRFGTTFNIAASLANPARPKSALRGVYSRALIEPVAQVMKQIGYSRALVVHGTIENCEQCIDELSVCGQSIVRHFNGSHEEHFEIAPEDAGIIRCDASCIAATGFMGKETERFISVISGTGEFSECEDFVALNAGAVLWLEGSSASIRAGVSDARHALRNGAARDKLKAWSAVQR